MSGTAIGGKKAAQTNKTKYGADFYARIGAVGGKKGTTGGFWYSKYILKNNFANQMAILGGRKSRRS